MAGVPARRGVSCALGLASALLVLAPEAAALEFFDGRIQIHGFAEEQIRTLNRNFDEEHDVAQWYNVINVEIEADILPDGWGPFDLLQAYARIEARYDCIYTHGCGMFQSINTYGDDAKRLPRRLRDATDQDYGGEIDTNAYAKPPGAQYPRISDERPSPFAVYLQVPNAVVPRDPFEDPLNPDLSPPPPGEYNPLLPCPNTGALGNCPDNRPLDISVRSREGFPGFDTLFETVGADSELGVNQNTGIQDDPAVYTLGPILDYRWTFREIRGPEGGTGETLIMGPWLPKNFIGTLGTLSDRANPFRGKQNALVNSRRVFGALQGPRDVDRRYQDLDIENVPGWSQLPDGTWVAPGGEVIFWGIDPVDPRVRQMVIDDGVYPALPGSQNQVLAGFGGDYSGIIPCWEPGTNIVRDDPTTAIDELQFSTNAQLQIIGTANGGRQETGCMRNFNIAVTGGTGELPFRPAPDVSNLLAFDPMLAQGTYIPSPGLRHALATQDFDTLDFNFRESERAWNRGASQQDTKELKEAYLDMEFFDSRLWIRAGLQNIVWGKTELFRTTDQFNPQDLALASLPSLEESRIALFAVRSVLSLYQIGPLEDVRVELAANFDQVEPSDLGACGEAFTIDVICALTAGLALHGVTGVGIAGIDRPENPWDDIKGLEFGGRVEFRWDRFSFAIADFYGYNDFPYPDPIFFYERNVDPATGRPRIAGATGSCANVALLRNARYQLDGTFAPLGTYDLDDPKIFEPMQGGLGSGIDPDCLKPGGAVGGIAENRFNPEFGNGDTNGNGVIDGGDLGTQWSTPGMSPENALEYHSANQSLFAFICLGTVTIASSLDPGACAWNIFGTPATLVGTTTNVVFSELVSVLMAGELDNEAMGFYRAIRSNTKGDVGIRVTPIRNLNIDENDGRITATSGQFNHDDGGDGTIDPIDLRADQPGDWLTLDRTLTNEQRALLGCGPFYGTRCDSGNQWFTAGIRLFGFGGGMDVLNGEGNVFVMSFSGNEGTGPEFFDEPGGWRTTSTEIQPGTIGFVGGEYCTRYQPGSFVLNPDGAVNDLVRLPGCRGAVSTFVNEDRTNVFFPNGTIDVVFEPGFDPLVDGCPIGPTIGDKDVVPVLAGSTYNPGDPLADIDATLFAQLETCRTTSTTRRQVLVDGGDADLLPDNSIPPNTPGFDGASIPDDLYTGTAVQVNTADSSIQDVLGAGTLWHPLAGCEVSPQFDADGPDNIPGNADDGSCTFRFRNFEQEFLDPDLNAQIFRSEIAALSWNFQVFLVNASCNRTTGDDISEPECFDPNLPYAMGRCSYTQPHLCSNVKAFLGVAGLNRNHVLAGGNPRFGRRDFIWHSGGELMLRYARRNVFGFSMDFAEDYTKTNWGMEFTWVGDMPFFDRNSFNNVTDSDTLNLTISVDRPTFINFLNANRTFFFNSQWFFQQILNHNSGFSSNGPFNVLFTFAVFTGYYQDRLLPQMVTVYDFGSRSGGFLPSVSYRFTEAFSVSIGMNVWIGRGQLKPMPLRGFAPTSNRAGPNRYKDGVENLISLFRHRDEAWVRLRWTF